MSFAIEYQPLVTVSAIEEVSGNGVEGLGFAPTDECRELLSNHQLVVRERESGFQVYYALNPQAADPLLGTIRERTRFTFAMVALGSGLFDRYEPDLGDTGPQLYLDNLDGTGSITTGSLLTGGLIVSTNDGVKIHPPVFSVGVESTATTLTILDRFDGSVVETIPVPASSGGEVRANVDLSKVPHGVYSMQSDAAGASTKTIYVDDELPGIRPLGVVDLYWQDAQTSAPAGGTQYAIRFRRR